MTTFLIAFVSALVVGAFLTRSVRDLAISRGWLDVAQSSRKVHTTPIPRVGGVAIVFGFFAPIGGLLLVSSDVGKHFQADPVFVYSIIGGGLAISLLGLYDDFVGARARQKFLAQFGVAALLCAVGLRVEVVSNPFGEALVLGWLAWPITMLWIVGVINALNLIDGLDGLAGGVAFIATATCFVLAWIRGDVVMTVLMAALAGALLGFLVFNFNPASIFMGDTGSMFLGFVLAVASLRTASKSDAAVATLVPLITLGLPIMDTLLAMGRRSLMGRPMFSADKEHIHHRLMFRLRLSHRGTVLALYGLCCFLAAVSFAMSFSNGWQSALLLVTLTSVAGLLLRQLGYLDLAALAAMVELRKRNKVLRRTVRAVSAEVLNAESLDEIWSRMEPLAETLNVAHLGFRFEVDKHRGRNELALHRQQVVVGISSLKIAVPVQWGGVSYGTLVADWRDGRAEVLRDEELGLERVAAALGRGLARLPPARAVVTHMPTQPDVLASALRAASGASAPSRSPRA